jgi:hypothetical protein
MRKFDQRYPDARTTSGKSSWPRGVHKISQIGLDNIGVDNEGRLYWNGQMVKEANPLELTHQQEVSAIIAVVSGVVLALSTLALAVVDTARRKPTSQRLCGRELQWVLAIPIRNSRFNLGHGFLSQPVYRAGDGTQ